MALSFEDMLDEFRALGGVADNVRRGPGRFGMGLFPIDPQQPVHLSVPESLLVPTDDLVFEDGALRVGPASLLSARQKAFIEAYAQEFSWGPGRQATHDALEMFSHAPPALRALMENPLNAAGWLAEPGPIAVQERFLGSRAISYAGRNVLMPVVELVNHGQPGRYRNAGGVAITGKFDGEILSEYQIGDPLRMFVRWGFASPEPMALCLAMRFETASGPIEIGRTPMRRDPKRLFYPDAAIENGVLKLSYLVLGHVDYPRLPKANFYRLMRDAGRGGDAEEAFDKLQHINRMQFVRLIKACDGAEPRLARLMRELACLQLEALSSYAGTADI